jgi:hypothetical protein
VGLCEGVRVWLIVLDCVALGPWVTEGDCVWVVLSEGDCDRDDDEVCVGVGEQFCLRP